MYFARFGIKMGNILDIGDDINIVDVNNIISSSRTEGYKNVSVKIFAENKMATNIFLENGFSLVDTQLVYVIPTERFKQCVSKQLYLDDQIVSFREYKENDKQQVMNIAKTAYVLDQYHSDTSLDNSLCDNYYAKWIKNCCDGYADKVLVASNNESGEVVGYMALKYKKDHATVILAAVKERYRGNGIFTFLLENTLSMLRIENVDKLYYGTQLANLPVLRAMGRFNGYIEYSMHVMHHSL